MCGIPVSKCSLYWHAISQYVGFISARSKCQILGVSPFRQRLFLFSVLFSTRPSMTDYNRYGKEARPTCIRRAREFAEAVRKNEFNGSRIEYVAQSSSLEMLNGSHVLLDHSSVFEANRSGVFLISGMRDDRLYLLPSNWHSADRNQYHCRHSRTHADVRWDSTLNQFELAVRELIRIE